MNVQDALKARKSVRAYLDKPVTHESILRILDAARWAPSGTNTQPWEVYVVQGDTKSQIIDALETQFEQGAEASMEYAYYPNQWFSPFQERRRACGLAMFSALEISRQDKDKRLAQWKKNYSAFGAPVILYFVMHKGLEAGSFFDYGMFYQSVMLAAMDEGLSTCPQAALAEFPQPVKDILGVGDDHLLLCGLALGYEDTRDVVNHYRTEREPIENFVTFTT